jgi:2-amino-4-hydroxy-6-hydroxymethyldihydropteridine diphosphokinase
LLDEIQYESERLTLPHPEVRSRRFVLVPLLELDPDAGLADALDALGAEGQGVRRVGPPLI